MKTESDVGTFNIVDCPQHCIPLPSKFAYQLKSDREGNVSRFRARICARGDLQCEWEYNTTYSPTSKFTAIRTIIAHYSGRLELNHWGIQGVFVTCDIDKEIYMELPQGYALQEGKCIQLLKSLYGLWQASCLFHMNLEEWVRADKLN